MHVCVCVLSVRVCVLCVCRKVHSVAGFYMYHEKLQCHVQYQEPKVIVMVVANGQ